MLFDVKPGHPGEARRSPTSTASRPSGRFTFTDAAGHVFPPQAKRLAPDFFFQQQIYRPDGGTVLLPPGEFTMEYGRGPEYQLETQKVTVPARRATPTIDGQARALDQPGGLRLLQRRPPHPRRRLRPLHEPDRGRAARGHVPARQGRGAERRLLPDVGAVLRLPAAVLRADAAQAQRAVHRPQVRRRGERLRLAGARATSAC